MFKKILDKVKATFELLLCKKDGLKDIVEKMSFTDWQNLSNPIYINNNILCFYPYSNKRVSKAISEIKYKANSKILQNIIFNVSEYIKDELGDKVIFEGFTNTVVIGIPSHKNKKQEKGYNQGELIAKELALLLELPHSNKILKKIRSTFGQRKLSRAERLKNLKGSMMAFRDKIQNHQYKSVIIIDDVCTTGSTFKEATRALNEIGVKKILCVALAH